MNCFKTSLMCTVFYLLAELNKGELSISVTATFILKHQKQTLKQDLDYTDIQQWRSHKRWFGTHQIVMQVDSHKAMTKRYQFPCKMYLLVVQGDNLPLVDSGSSFNTKRYTHFVPKDGKQIIPMRSWGPWEKKIEVHSSTLVGILGRALLIQMLSTLIYT